MKKTEKKGLVAASMLAANFSRLEQELADVEKAGADVIHVDVMDGHFVPNLTIGPPVIKSLRQVTKLPLDVHLMIDEPIDSIEDYVKAGSDWITFHVEATQRVQETIEIVKKSDVRVGLSVKPKTPVAAIEPYLKELDLVLVMSVEPGFGGQSFMPDMMQKIRELRPKFSGLISVDGGINAQTAVQAAEAGVDILVAGTAVFGSDDRKNAVDSLRRTLT